MPLTLEFGINFGQRLLIYGFFPETTSLLQGAKFTIFFPSAIKIICYFREGLRLFKELRLLIFAKGAMLFKGIRLFRTLECVEFIIQHSMKIN